MTGKAKSARAPFAKKPAPMGKGDGWRCEEGSQAPTEKKKRLEAPYAEKAAR